MRDGSLAMEGVELARPRAGARSRRAAWSERASGTPIPRPARSRLEGIEYANVHPPRLAPPTRRVCADGTARASTRTREGGRIRGRRPDREWAPGSLRPWQRSDYSCKKAPAVGQTADSHHGWWGIASQARFNPNSRRSGSGNAARTAREYVVHASSRATRFRSSQDLALGLGRALACPRRTLGALALLGAGVLKVISMVFRREVEDQHAVEVRPSRAGSRAASGQRPRTCERAMFANSRERVRANVAGLVFELDSRDRDLEAASSNVPSVVAPETRSLDSRERRTALAATGTREGAARDTERGRARRRQERVMIPPLAHTWLRSACEAGRTARGSSAPGRRSGG